MKVMLI